MNAQPMTPDRLQKRAQLRDDFDYFSRLLKIRTQQGGLAQFRMTEQQRKLHDVAERQLRERGCVRIIVAKGRKTKTSTYVQARFYWKVTHRKGVKAYVIAHDQETTDEIFSMTDRFYRNFPSDPTIRPTATNNSVRQLRFEELDSEYSVGTAGSKNTGRGMTPHYLHGSELAYWPRGEEIARGVITAVGEMPGTEVWLESTGNGPGDYFHSQVMAAINGENGYELVFLEWWLEPQYQSDMPIALTEEEQKMLATYPRLTVKNLAFRRKRIAEYGGDVNLFRKEFPMSVGDVFASSERVHIPPDLVDAAVSREYGPDGPLVMGVDPGGGGHDPTAVVLRKGGNFIGKWLINDSDPEYVAGRVSSLIEEFKPKATFVDNIGVGYHLVTILSARHAGVRGIDFRRLALDEKRYKNRRAEAYDNLKEWIKTASIPDDKLLRMELSVFQSKFTPNGQMILESKEDAKARGHKSPNVSDALALTVAEPVETGILESSLWHIWPHVRKPKQPKSEMLPDCHFITAYAWMEDEKWCIAVVGVFLPDSERRRQAGQDVEKANAIVLKQMDGTGVYAFMDAAEKLWNTYKPDYFYVPTKTTIVVKDLRVKNLRVQKARHENLEDVVAVGHSVLKEGCAWLRNNRGGRMLAARLERYPYGDDGAVYGCISLALSHLRQRGNLAVQWDEDVDDDLEGRRNARNRRDRRTAY